MDKGSLIEIVFNNFNEDLLFSAILSVIGGEDNIASGHWTIDEQKIMTLDDIKEKSLQMIEGALFVNLKELHIDSYLLKHFCIIIGCVEKVHGTSIFFWTYLGGGGHLFLVFLTL